MKRSTSKLERSCSKVERTSLPAHMLSPFPYTWPTGPRAGCVIINEACKCGHRRTNHGPGGLGAFGHGECYRCGCSKFTWVRFVVKGGAR